LANVAIRSDEATYREQDLWIDEGLSSAAEYLYLGNHAETGRVWWFNTDQDNTIAEGNNFFVWDGGLDEYATVYLFFQWLRIQGGGNGIYKDIITSKDIGCQAVTGPAGERIGGSFADWETLLRSWFAANYIVNSTGVYGYRGEISPQVHTIPSGGDFPTIIPLKPGEGVYSVLSDINDFSGSGTDISYAGLKKAEAEVNTDSSPTGERLLTFNKNSNNHGATEDGETTGVVAASLQPGGGMAARAAADVPAFQGPYPIGVRDYLNGRNPGPGVPNIPNRGNIIPAGDYVKK
jgi:hypothetical protein